MLNNGVSVIDNDLEVARNHMVRWQQGGRPYQQLREATAMYNAVARGPIAAQFRGPINQVQQQQRAIMRQQHHSNEQNNNGEAVIDAQRLLEMRWSGGSTFLHLAAREGHVHVFKWWKHHHHDAAEAFSAEEVQRLAQERRIEDLFQLVLPAGGASPAANDANHDNDPGTNGSLWDVRDDEGLTPLFEAVRLHREEVVKYLLDEGADATVRLPNGRSLLHVAASSGVPVTVMQRLIALGASVSETQQGTPRIARLVQQRLGREPGSLVNGITPLHLLCLYASSLKHAVALATLLLQHGADPNAATEGGSTPLHFLALAMAGSASERPRHLLRALLWAGADVKALDEGGSSPFDYAVTAVSSMNNSPAALQRTSSDCEGEEAFVDYLGYITVGGGAIMTEAAWGAVRHLVLFQNASASPTAFPGPAGQCTHWTADGAETIATGTEARKLLTTTKQVLKLDPIAFATFLDVAYRR